MGFHLHLGSTPPDRPVFADGTMTTGDSYPSLSIAREVDRRPRPWGQRDRRPMSCLGQGGPTL
jgi:hypothetical protein